MPQLGRQLALVPVALLALAAGPRGAQAQGSGTPAGFSVVRDKDLTWSPAAAPLPPGAEIAVLAGDPGQPGPFTYRLKMPAGFRIPPHVHPAAERVMVVRGRLGIGSGEDFDESRLEWLTRGDFFAIGEGVAHYGLCRAGCIIEIDAVGPWGLTYVDPADAP